MSRGTGWGSKEYWVRFKDVKGTRLAGKSVKGYWVVWQRCRMSLGRVAKASVGIGSGGKGYLVR